jgi:hypothetical protein
MLRGHRARSHVARVASALSSLSFRVPSRVLSSGDTTAVATCPLRSGLRLSVARVNGNWRPTIHLDVPPHTTGSPKTPHRAPMVPPLSRKLHRRIVAFIHEAKDQPERRYATIRHLNTQLFTISVPNYPELPIPHYPASPSLPRLHPPQAFPMHLPASAQALPLLRGCRKMIVYTAAKEENTS